MFCCKCGKEIKEGNKFCTDCGTPVETDVQSNSNIVSAIKSAKCMTEYPDDTFADIMDTVKIGKYPQNDVSGKKAEEIEWLLLKKETDRALLISKHILDCQKYDNEGNKKSWVESTIRKWLNDNFYSASFSDNEKELIIESNNKNRIALGYNDFTDDADSKEKVFLLNILELQTLFNNKLNDYFLRLCAKPTEFAMVSKKDINNYTLQLEVENHTDLNKWANGTCWYWLRDTVDSGNAAVINGNGSVGYTCGLEQTYNSVGIRPAMWVKI